MGQQALSGWRTRGSLGGCPDGRASRRDTRYETIQDHYGGSRERCAAAVRLRRRPRGTEVRLRSERAGHPRSRVLGQRHPGGFYQSAIAKFNEKYPNITVNSTFLAFPEFWEKRQIEAAGRDLPDVMQFDYAYLRQYSQNRLLLDLKPYLGKYIKTDGFTESTLGIGVVNGVTTALPVGTNAWAMFTNTALLGKSGGTPYAGGTSWDEYATWMGSVTKAAAVRCGVARTRPDASRTSRSPCGPTARTCSTTPARRSSPRRN
ncbi:ABC transporter substrate-binding protein [Catellatospora coxensis]